MFDLSSGIAKLKLRSLSRLLARFHITVTRQASTTGLEYLASALVSHMKGVSRINDFFVTALWK